MSFSDTLIAPSVAMSLLSVPKITKKEITVLFLPGKSIIFDLKDNNSVLGYSTKDSDGMNYIEEHQDEYSVDIDIVTTCDICHKW